MSPPDAVGCLNGAGVGFDQALGRRGAVSVYSGSTGRTAAAMTTVFVLGLTVLSGRIRGIALVRAKHKSSYVLLAVVGMRLGCPLSRSYNFSVATF